MTWDDLAKQILEMTEGERAKEVQYLEPWGEAAEIFVVGVMIANKDLADPEGVVRIQKGDNFLQ